MKITENSPDVVRFSAYLTSSQYKRLRNLAHINHCKLNTLLCEALNTFLRGVPETLEKSEFFPMGLLQDTFNIKKLVRTGGSYAFLLSRWTEKHCVEFSTDGNQMVITPLDSCPEIDDEEGNRKRAFEESGVRKVTKIGGSHAILLPGGWITIYCHEVEGYNWVELNEDEDKMTLTGLRIKDFERLTKLVQEVE